MRPEGGGKAINERSEAQLLELSAAASSADRLETK